MTEQPSARLYDRVAFIGFGLIASSMARALRRDGLVAEIAATARSEETRARALALGLADAVSADIGETVADADLIVVATPVGAMAQVAAELASHLKPGATVTDVGSVKTTVIRDIGPALPEGVHFIPGHPIAGTEHSGPDAGFAELFEGRWCILTPPPGTDEAAVARLSQLWEALGSKVTEMEAGHHDKVLAITSHLPHLIAYTIVGTATDLEDDLQREVIAFSASGFRDFTRIAASDPVMWRDIFLANREAVLEMLQRFTEDLTGLQRAIRWGEGEALERYFERTRSVRKGVIEARQA